MVCTCALSVAPAAHPVRIYHLTPYPFHLGVPSVSPVVNGRPSETHCLLVSSIWEGGRLRIFFWLLSKLVSVWSLLPIWQPGSYVVCRGKSFGIPLEWVVHVETVLGLFSFLLVTCVPSGMSSSCVVPCFGTYLQTCSSYSLCCSSWASSHGVPRFIRSNYRQGRRSCLFCFKHGRSRCAALWFSSSPVSFCGKWSVRMISAFAAYSALEA